MEKKVFLGGTCNGSLWREELIPRLNIKFFNPVVPEWTAECQIEEKRQREVCDYCLYVITPKMSGVYSIAEVVDDSNKRPEKTILCVLLNDGDSNFKEHQIKSLNQVEELVANNGAIVLHDLEAVADFLNR